MKILIVPTVREVYQNQFEYSFDFKLINFISKIFKNSHIEIFNSTTTNNYDLVVYAGGNNTLVKSKADKIRNKANNYIYKLALKKKIKILGICHGAHFLAKKFGFKIKKKKNHVGDHNINFCINRVNFKKTMNSYHNETIEFKKNPKVNIFATANDNTIEAFHVMDKKILGIMWHPERYNNIKHFDKKLLKEFNATNSIVGR